MIATQQNQQLAFLTEKIHEIGSAIFFNLSDSVLKLPTSIVNTLKVDDFGYVWFLVKKPKQDLKEFEKEFPVRLDYFKKGKEYFLQVTGKGWMISDPEELNAFITFSEDVDHATFEDMVLVKVKMLKAEYYETQSRTNNSWWQNAVNTIFTWFRSTNSVGSNTYLAS